jgi:outer membrane lipoprotein-sorting protein
VIYPGPMRAAHLPRTRAIAFAVAISLVGASALLLVRADPSPALPRVRPGELLASTMRALEQPYSVSGRVTADVNVSRRHHRGDRGGVLTHTVFRVWRSTRGVRVAQILDFGERLLVADRDEAWLWDSQTLTASHLASTDVTGGRFDFTPTLAADPFSLARSILGTFAPYSTVKVIDTGSVAGRPVYLLSLRSEQRHTRLHKVVMSIDAHTRLPLELKIYTHRLVAPAVDVAFTSISFAPVAASLFRFTPPNAATVVNTDVFAGGGRAGGALSASSRTFGRGWKTRIAWELSRRLSRDAVGAFPIWNAIGSSVTARVHGRTRVLAGFVSLHVLEGDVPKLR